MKVCLSTELNVNVEADYFYCTKYTYTYSIHKLVSNSVNTNNLQVDIT